MATIRGHLAAAGAALLLAMAAVTYWSWGRAEDARAEAQIQRDRAMESAQKVSDWSAAYQALVAQSALADKAIAAAQEARAARAQTLTIDTAHLRAELRRIADACAATAVPAAVDEFLRQRPGSGAAGADAGDAENPDASAQRLPGFTLGGLNLD